MADNPFAQFADDQSANASANPFAQFSDDGGSSQGGKPVSWGDVPLQAITNAPGSLANVIGGIGHSIMHPIDTATNLVHLGVGSLHALGRAAINVTGSHTDEPVGPDERAFNTLKDYYVNRYGTSEGLKTALAKDPVGVLADASVVLGGGAEGIRAAGMTGKVADAMAAASKATNPVTLAAKGTGALASGAGKLATGAIGDLGTRTGETPLGLAYQAGKNGGSAAANFMGAMTEQIPQEQSVQMARQAVQEMRRQKNDAYQNGMAGIAAKTEQQQWANKAQQLQYNARAEDSGLATKPEPVAMMNFDNVDKKLVELNKLGDFQGKDIDPAAAEARDLVSTEVSDWKNLDPASFHTPMGFDALKQRLYSLADKYPVGSRARLYMDKAAAAVKDSIVEQAPEYSKVMKDYWGASDQLRQIEGELSLKPGANVGTTLRKLQSTMRNNVNTNYGYRGKLVDSLTQYGAGNLPYQLAGQSLSSWAPRGLGAGAAAADIIASLAVGHTAPLAALPFMSPRLMGNAFYGAGKVASKLPTVDWSKAHPYSSALYASSIPYRTNQ